MDENSDENSQVLPAVIEDEMKEAYLDYSMSVIVGRALPDVRDGLKPVHRRILYAMHSMGMTHRSAFRKSARIVGEVLGKYHPHGDSAVYDSLVRMAQDFSLRYTLVQGHGNFGSVDGDNAAAMRYCISGDSLLLTDKGLIEISSLSNKKEDKINLKVASYLNKNKASKFFNSGKHEVIEIKTEQGYKIKGSLNHPVLTWSLDEFGSPTLKWKLLEDITKKDVLVLNRKSDLFSKEYFKLKEVNNKKYDNVSIPKKLDKDLAFVLGAITAEGSYHNKQILFCNQNKEYYSKVKKILQKKFKKIKLYERILNDGSQELSIYQQKVVKTLENNGLTLKKSNYKEIPHSVLQSPKKVLASFLTGLFEGDGSVILKEDKRHEGKSIELTYNSKSEKLISQLKTVLLNYGIVTTKPYKDKRNDCYKLIISGQSNIVLFKKEIGFFSKRKKEAINNKVNNDRMSKTDFIPYLNDYLRNNYKQSEIKRNNFDRYNRLKENYSKLKLLNKRDKSMIDFLLKNEFYFNKVTNITKKPKETVYSIKVDSDCHSFTANGFINHNTEARLAEISQELLQDIDKETVDFIENFDGSLTEPTVLPTKIPTLLVNGSTGIAVGMATNIPPHNLKEVLQGVIAIIDNPDIEDIELFDIVKGPDFPTGGIILGRQGILDAYKTGRGRVLVRSKIDIEETSTGKRKIIVTELPYMVNKATLVEQIANLVKDKKIEGISDLRDESDRKGMRVAIELKKDADVELLKNQLFKHTRLQDSFSILILALDGKQPKTHNLRELLSKYLMHRKEIITRRTKYDLRKAEDRAHVIEGLLTALDDIDNVIALIKKSESGSHAKEGLMREYSLSEVQSQAILEMRLQKLAKLESNKLKEEFEELQKTIKELKEILADENKVLNIVKEESNELIEKYGDKRKTEITDVEYADMDYEDLIPQEEVVITLSKEGYVKRAPLTTYKVQKRGGVGIIGTSNKEEDFTTEVFIANTHSYLLIFTDKGIVHWLKVYKIPELGRYGKGKAIVNLIDIDSDDRITSIIPVREFSPGKFLITTTKKGVIKKTSLDAYSRPRKNGIIALTLDEGDSVRSVRLTDGTQNVMIATRKGQACKFHEEKVRTVGRTSRGVRGINLNKDDEVVDMIIVDENTDVLTLTKKGYGKRTNSEEYRLTNRGGKGVRNINITDKNKEVVKVSSVIGDEQLMLITRKGMVIRTTVTSISKIGRNTQGVRVIRLREDDELISAAKIIDLEEDI